MTVSWIRLSSTAVHPNRLVIAAKVEASGIGRSPIPTLTPTTIPIAVSELSNRMPNAIGAGIDALGPVTSEDRVPSAARLPVRRHRSCEWSGSWHAPSITTIALFLTAGSWLTAGSVVRNLILASGLSSSQRLRSRLATTITSGLVAMMLSQPSVGHSASAVTALRPPRRSAMKPEAPFLPPR